MKKFKLIIPGSLLLVSIILGFSILTDDDGRYRSYRLNDLPFIYYVHVSTPENYLASIQAGSQTWNDVAGSYFEFSYGGKTNSHSVSRDDTSLVYFDSTHENFENGTSTIAFSSTYITGYSTPNYRAVESDLIWNSADYPPSTTGAAGAQDLQSVITHEFGHHLGLGHTGEPGSPPGVGDIIQEATMYGYSNDGDTTKRSLHIDDMMGVISIYPRWTLEATVVDSITNELLGNANYYLNGQANASVSPVVLETVYQRAGYVWTELSRVNEGTAFFKVRSTISNPLITLSAYGYKDKTVQVHLGQANTIDTVVTAVFTLSPRPKYSVSIQLTDASTGAGVNARSVLLAESDLFGTDLRQEYSDQNHQTNLELAEDTYDISIHPELPYPYVEIENLAIHSDTTIALALSPANLALIADVDSLSDQEKSTSRDFYFTNLAANSVANDFAFLELPADSLSQEGLNQIPVVIWYTSKNQNMELKTETSKLMQYLDQGGKLILSGRELMTAELDSVFMKDFLHVQSAGTSSTQLLRGVEGDPIGNNEFLGVNLANAQRMQKDSDPKVTDVFKYLGTAYAGAVKYDGDFRLVLYSFGLEDISKNYLDPEVVFSRSLEWIQTASSVLPEAGKSPKEFYLSPNYPNPFNPVTHFTIHSNAKQRIKIQVYNVLGKLVANLFEGDIETGIKNFTWKGRDESGQTVSSGIYYLKVSRDSEQLYRKMILIR